MKRGIALEEVTALLRQWFVMVETAASARERASLYLHPHPMFIMPDGSSMDMESHHNMHTKWCDERHECGELYITPLSASPERVRVEGTVYWEAHYKGTKQVIKTVVGKSMIIERIADGTLRFVLHQNISIHPLPGSAKMVM